MYKPIEVKAIKKYIIWVKYPDGSNGQIDLSDLAQKPLFQFWNEGENFFNVYIEQETGAIAWKQDIEICPDRVYYEINKNHSERRTMDAYSSSIVIFK